VNCENRPTPKRSTAGAKTAPRGSGKDGGVAARPITTTQRLAQPLRANSAAAQWVNYDGRSLHDHATVLLPSASFNTYQFRESSRPVTALGCRVVDLGVQVFAELANAYVNRRIRQCVTSGKDGF
jgi:hypothetical protein